MAYVADRPTFLERLGAMGKAAWKITLDRPCITAIVFFVLLTLLGAPVLLMLMLFLAGWYGYCAGQRKRNQGQSSRREV